MDNKINVLLDVDDVICFPSYLAWINELLNTNFQEDDFKDYIKEKEIMKGEELQEFNKFIKDRNPYQEAIILPKAIEVIKKHLDTCNYYMLSSCINPCLKEESGKLFTYKYNFLLKILPFINPENFVFTNAKHLLKGDIQIDDYLPHLLANKTPYKILFPAAHNKSVQDVELKKNKIVRAGSNWRNGWENIDILLEKQEAKSKKLLRKKN